MVQDFVKACFLILLVFQADKLNFTSMLTTRDGKTKSVIVHFSSLECCKPQDSLRCTPFLQQLGALISICVVNNLKKKLILKTETCNLIRCLVATWVYLEGP